jgi:hypothetical protein
MLGLKRFTRCAWVVVTIAAASPQAHAQGLADAARQAGEQRKAAEGQPRITIVAVPEQTLPTVALSRPDVEHYTHLRMAMADLWHRDLRVYERMRGGAQTARSLDELLKVLDAEPEVQKLFQIYNYTSEGFLSMMNSIARAETLRESGVRADTIPSIEFMNYNFIAKERVWLSLMRGRIYKAEGGLSIWH